MRQTNFPELNLLIISTPAKLKRTKYLWLAVGQLAKVRHEILETGNYANLKDIADRCDFKGFDRVIVDHNLRRMQREYKQLSRIPNLVLFDFDFYINYLPDGECPGKLESVLKTLNEHRLITSGCAIKDDLLAKGFDAAYSPKAYDAHFVQDLGTSRDIGLGFIGRSNHWAYDMRRKMLDHLQKEFGLEVLRTEENEEYGRALSRIKIFINPDLGYNEIMIKNFEAMAAGCALVAPKPLKEEQVRLDWVDGENVVLYESYDELVKKAGALQKEPDRVQRIAKAGQDLTVRKHRWEARAPDILELIQPPLRRPPPLTWKDRWNLLTL